MAIQSPGVNGTRSRILSAILALLLAIPGGYALMWPLGRLCDLAGWPVFNTWALNHGAAIIAWPLLSLLMFLLVWYVLLPHDLNGSRSRILSAFLALLFAIPGGYALMWPLGRLFDLAGWPVFNMWALKHGSAIIAWPLLSLVVLFFAWHVLLRGAHIRRSRDSAV